MPRLYISLTNAEFQALDAKSNTLGFTCSQYAKYLILEDLRLPQKNSIPLLHRRVQMEKYIQALKRGEPFIVSAPFDDWWSFDTGAKRSMAWHLKHLEECGLCKKTGVSLPNGTAIYERV